jgi:hypothetical protein
MTASSSNEDRAVWADLVARAENAARMNAASAEAHFEAAERYEALHTRLGIILIVLTAMTSASLLQAIGEGSASWQKITAASLSALATAAAALQTFLRAAEKSKRHDRAARAYQAVCGELMGFLNDLAMLPPGKQRRVTVVQRQGLSDADIRRRNVDGSAPRLPKRQRRIYDGLVEASLAQLKNAEETAQPPGFARP